MGLFNFKKSKKQKQEAKESTAQNKDHITTFVVDDIFQISTVSDFMKVDGDRFRLATEDGKVRLSISNYLSTDNIEDVNKEYLKELILPLYKDYQESGGYEAYDDLITENDHISQSFKVDDETQYYLTTVKKWGDQTVLTTFIMRDIDEYSEDARKILFYSFYKMTSIG